MDGGSGAPDLAVAGSAPDLAPSDPNSPAPDLTTPDDPSDPTLIAARPYGTQIPDSYDASKPTPLLVMLHGFSANANLQDLYLGIGKQTTDRGWLFAMPDGTQNPAGLRYWEATDACCNFANPPQDDVAYLNAVIADMKSHYNVDPKRVYLFGHSNGGFMSHRMACDSSDVIAAIGSLAGATWGDDALCAPSHAIGVLEIHGTLDLVVSYNGGSLVPGGASFPSAPATVSTWAAHNGCGALTDTSEKGDYESLLLGKETKISRASGCQQNGAAELWTVQGGGHVPFFNDTFYEALFAFYDAHAKP